MSLASTVSIAKVGTNSLRATIPEGIVAYIDLQAGDKLEWRMEVTKDGKKIVTVSKADIINKKVAKIGYKYRPKGDKK